MNENPIQKGAFIEEDVIPESLDPLFQCIFIEQWGWIKTLVKHIDSYCEKNPEAKRVPRVLGMDSFEIQGCKESRKLITFGQWKAQRAQRAFFLSEETNRWLQRVLQGTKLSPQDCIPEIKNPLLIKNFKVLLQQRI